MVTDALSGVALPLEIPTKICYTVNMTYYDKILNEELLKQEFITNKKTSRQIAREFKASRKVINYLLVEYGLIAKSSLEESDLP